MSKKLILVIFAALAIIATAAIIIKTTDHTDSTEIVKTDNDKKDKEAIPDPVEKTLDEKVEAELQKMTLDQKIAQLLIVEAPARTINNELSQQMSTAPYGGFILMSDAYGTLAETRDFVRKLREASAYPLIISTDQEGGTVQRINNISSPKATTIPFAADMASKDDANLVKEIGGVVGKELSAIGINLDFAPVQDVNSNPSNPVIGRRSFSNDPNEVAEYSLAFANGLAESHVTPVYKHFPGHGDTETDSHKTLPIVNRARAELDALELVPFKKAIESGAEMIMVAHIALPQITGDNTPATMSHKITTELLREELGFEGLIITDGVNMGALTKNYPAEEIYYRVVEAGADLVLMPENPQLAMSSIKAHISESRIDESVRRILRYKYGPMSEWKRLDESNFGNEANRAIVDKAK